MGYMGNLGVRSMDNCIPGSWPKSSMGIRIRRPTGSLSRPWLHFIFCEKGIVENFIGQDHMWSTRGRFVPGTSVSLDRLKVGASAPVFTAFPSFDPNIIVTLQVYGQTLWYALGLLGLEVVFLDSSCHGYSGCTGEGNWSVGLQSISICEIVRRCSPPRWRFCSRAAISLRVSLWKFFLSGGKTSWAWNNAKIWG